MHGKQNIKKSGK